MNELVFFLVFFSSLFILLLFEKYSYKLGFIDLPGQRKIHKAVVPRNGGFVIFAACISALFFFENQFLKGLIVPFVIIYIGGAIDDFRKETPAYVKLAFQITATFIFLYGLDLPWLLKIVLFVFQIAMTNSFNLLDNMNGITVVLSSGIIAIFTFFFEPLRTFFVTSYFASATAFFIRNYPNGKIFLGDQGSQLLGFLASSLFILLFVNSSPADFSDVVEILKLVVIIFGVFFVFILDTFWVIYIRTKNGKSIFHGDQNHLSHNLHRMGLPVAAVPWVLLLVQSATALLSVFAWRQLSHQ